MNLLALITLNAYINLELQALQVLCSYKSRVLGFKSYDLYIKKIDKLYKPYMVYNCSLSQFDHFLNNLECFDTVQCIDLELPCVRVFVLAYCVIHNETPYFQEFAHKQQAIQHCDSKGLGYKVLCKYASCDCNNTWFDDIVHHASVTVYMTLDNMLNVVSSLPIRHSTDWSDATMLDNLISDIQEGYLSTNHTENKLYKVTVQTKFAYWYSIDKPNTMPPSLSMLVAKLIIKLELTCISLLAGRSYGVINHPSDPIGKAFFDLSYSACKAIGFTYPSQLFGLFPPIRQTI